MARQARNLIDGAYYHIITRGNDRRKLFRYSQDYKHFLKIIAKYLKKFDIRIIHYCLMPNHIHLLIKAEKALELPKFIQAILLVYAGYFKAKYDCVGFIFQNRYKSCIIERDAYLLECARYIERNPVRAKLAEAPQDYPWSSFPFYSQGTEDELINFVNPLYIEFALSEQERRQKYHTYVSESRAYDYLVDKGFRIG